MLVADRRRSRRQQKERILLNFPPELAQRVRDLAERERRSLTTQIQVLVERALEEQEPVAA